jgi:hypothetical protein
MNKFNVEIHHPDNAFAPTILLQMEPGGKVMEVAERLSVAYPGHRVTVSMFARIRRAYKDGKTVNSFPDLGKFYSDVSAQDHWDWACFGQVKE